jgi:hypothetical protein
MVGFFVLFNYLHFRFNWTKEKFKTSLEQEMKELSPVAFKELSALGKELLPVYAEHGKKQFSLLMPEISNVLQEELTQLCNEILAGTHHRLELAEERVIEKTEQELFKNYPDLNDVVKREELEARFRKEAEKAALDTIHEFDKLFSRDIDESKSLLLKFDVRDTEETRLDLQKKFFRLWLRLLDLEITEL